jgi:hypothetical protein
MHWFLLVFFFFGLQRKVKCSWQHVVQERRKFARGNVTITREFYFGPDMSTCVARFETDRHLERM